MQCFTTVSTANALAISPCASPPIPSERTKRFSDSTSRKQSSLFDRTCPTSVAPPLRIRTNTPRLERPDAHTKPGNPHSTLSKPTQARKAVRPTDYSRIDYTTNGFGYTVGPAAVAPTHPE